MAYAPSVEHWRTVFEPLSEEDLAAWFISMDEQAVIGFEILQGETLEQAEARHQLQLRAMAEALESLPMTSMRDSTVRDLRRLLALSEAGP